MSLPTLQAALFSVNGYMSPSDALPEANAIPGILSAADVGLLTNSTLRANISVVNRDYRLLYVNAHYAESCATTQDKLIGLSLFDLHDEAQMRELAPYFQRVHNGETVSYVRLSRIGELDSRWVTVSLSPWRGSAGEISGSVLVSMPVHDIKVNAETLRAANERLTSHIDNSPLAILELDKHLSIASCSLQFRSLVGLDGGPAIGAPLLDVLDAGEPLQPLVLALARLQSGVETRNRTEVALRHASGTIVYSEWFNSALTDAQGKVSSIMSLVQDTTARTLAEARLLEIAMHDPLTGVSNRRGLTDRIDRAAQSVEAKLALLLVDLDGFKSINDTHGHAAGDEVLCEVARRLIEFAPAVETVARIGGDEFVLLVEGTSSTQSERWLLEFATRIMRTLEAPYVIGDVRLHISASIGVAQCPPAAPNAGELIARADMAMYDAKRAGKARVHFAHIQTTR